MKKRKDGRYLYRPTINGKQVNIYGNSEKECIHKYDKMVNRPQESKTFGFYVDGWSKSHMELVTHNTWYKNYVPCLDKLQELNELKIDEILAPDLQQIINRYASMNYSKKILNRLKSTTSQVLDYAIGCGERITNFASSVKIPRAATETHRESLTLEEMQTILNCGELYPIFLLLTGLRRGEITALQWKHIDLESNTISVVQSVEFINNNPVIKSTKTRAGVRTVPIPQKLKDMLVPIEPKDKEFFVFGNEKMWTQEKNKKYWMRLMKNTGLNVTQHQLRHSYASILAWTDVVNVKDIQSVLGHSDSRTTMQIYAHAQEQKKAIPNIENALNNFFK